MEYYLVVDKHIENGLDKEFRSPTSLTPRPLQHNHLHPTPKSTHLQNTYVLFLNIWSCKKNNSDVEEIDANYILHTNYEYPLSTYFINNLREMILYMSRTILNKGKNDPFSFFFLAIFTILAYRIVFLIFLVIFCGWSYSLINSPVASFSSKFGEKKSSLDAWGDFVFS